MANSTDIDRHRIACECFEGHRGFVPSDLRIRLKKRLAEFDDAVEAVAHCTAMCKRWKDSGITNPSALTEVLKVEDVQPEIENPDPVEVTEVTDEPPMAEGGVETDPSLPQGEVDDSSGS